MQGEKVRDRETGREFLFFFATIRGEGAENDPWLINELKARSGRCVMRTCQGLLNQTGAGGQNRSGDKVPAAYERWSQI